MLFQIITNNVPRDIIEAGELTEDEQAKFDYLDWPAIRDGRDNASFFRYKGELYDLGEFMAVSTQTASGLAGWDGFQADSYFSGLAVRYVLPGYEQLVVARVIS